MNICITLYLIYWLSGIIGSLICMKLDSKWDNQSVTIGDFITYGILLSLLTGFFIPLIWVFGRIWEKLELVQFWNKRLF